MPADKQGQNMNDAMAKQPQTVRVRGDMRPKHIGRVERMVKDLMAVFRDARKQNKQKVLTNDAMSRLDYKLAQRLDSAGFPEIAQEIAVISERKPGSLGLFIKSL